MDLTHSGTLPYRVFQYESYRLCGSSRFVESAGRVHSLEETITSNSILFKDLINYLRILYPNEKFVAYHCQCIKSNWTKKQTQCKIKLKCKLFEFIRSRLTKILGICPFDEVFSNLELNHEWFVYGIKCQ